MPAPSKGGICALLLAAGESTRMGMPKALLPWHGQTLLEHQVNALTVAGVSRVVAVLGHEADNLEPLLKDRPGVRCVLNPDYLKGKTTSVKAGLRALVEASSDSLGRPHEQAVLILNVDQPRSADTIRRVIDLHRKGRDSRGHRYAITVPTYRGKGGHPAIFSTALWSELMAISEDTMGLKAVVRRREKNTQRVEMDSPEMLLDLNDPQDYRRALEMFAVRS